MGDNSNEELINAIVNGVKESLGIRINGHDIAISKIEESEEKQSIRIYDLEIKILQHANRIEKVEIQCKNNESSIIKVDGKLESIQTVQKEQNINIGKILDKVKYKRAAIIAWIASPVSGTIILWLLNWLSTLLKVKQIIP